jgi:hypothetical protein
MSSPTLGQQLLRDLRRNPKKAGLLALLAGVAIWFWAPLFVGLFKGEQLANAVADGSPAAPAVSPVSTASAGVKTETAKVVETATQTWQQLVEWMNHDPRRKADDIRLKHDPFEPPARPAAKAETDEANPPPSPSIDIENIGLKLTGTVVGGQRRLALINGRAYAEGQAVHAAADAVFVVRQVEAKKVTLERDGKPLVLEAVKP